MTDAGWIAWGLVAAVGSYAVVSVALERWQAWRCARAVARLVAGYKAGRP